MLDDSSDRRIASRLIDHVGDLGITVVAQSNQASDSQISLMTDMCPWGEVMARLNALPSIDLAIPNLKKRSQPPKQSVAGSLSRSLSSLRVVRNRLDDHAI